MLRRTDQKGQGTTRFGRWTPMGREASCCSSPARGRWRGVSRPKTWDMEPPSKATRSGPATRKAFRDALIGTRGANVSAAVPMGERQGETRPDMGWMRVSSRCAYAFRRTAHPHDDVWARCFESLTQPTEPTVAPPAPEPSAWPSPACPAGNRAGEVRGGPEPGGAPARPRARSSRC
jgi:hypothetical protein